ncbi:MAG: hypothetical protein ABI345_06220 [Jatrophihabitans sp.]
MHRFLVRVVAIVAAVVGIGIASSSSAQAAPHHPTRAGHVATAHQHAAPQHTAQQHGSPTRSSPGDWWW